MTKRLVNETDETIALEPGESMDFIGPITESKVLVSKLKRIKIQERK